MRNKKARFQVNFFYFKIFETFGNLEIDFGISFKKNVFNKLSILSELHYFFVKILTQYKKDLKHVVTMSSHQDIV